MQSKIKEVTEVKESKYPCLKIFEGRGDWDKIVMFSSPCTGVVVHAIGNLAVLGEYCDSWEENNFRDFNGTIELSN